MIVEKDDSLQLYIHEREPIMVYIVADRVIMFDEGAGSSGYIDTAFYFLQEILDNKHTRHVFPKQLHKQFKELRRKGLKFTKSLCFCGYGPKVDALYLNCLAMKMTIDLKNTPKIVKLSNFARIEESRKFVVNSKSNEALVAAIPGKVLLTAEDAFLLLSNINTVKFSLASYDNDFSPFNGPSIREQIDKMYENRKESYLVQQYHGKLYCIDYLEYIAQELASKKISPERILRLNGAEVLAILVNIPVIQDYIESSIKKLQNNISQLSQNHKLQYYLLLLLCRFIYKDKIHFIKHFYCENEHLMSKLTKELERKQNLLDYKTISWNQVNEMYLK
ncbi:MAG: hypothetical protein HZR80_02765 [Candidatus Heimdallarchaeota archaeon]